MLLRQKIIQGVEFELVRLESKSNRTKKRKLSKKHLRIFRQLYIHT